MTLCAPFSAETYGWERGLFGTFFLRRWLRLSPPRTRQILSDLESAAHRLLGAPPVLVHRDLQSSNILMRGREPLFIDFQGLRLGPALYDIASLLCDPYMSLPDSVQEELLEYYAERRRQPLSAVAPVFWNAAVQRLAQALGAYARLGLRQETAHFRTHIMPGLKMLDRAARKSHSFDSVRRLVSSVIEHPEAMP